MPKFVGTWVAAGNDPITIDSETRGGLQVVANSSERLNIQYSRRKIGMRVVQADTQIVYKLLNLGSDGVALSESDYAIDSIVAGSNIVISNGTASLNSNVNITSLTASNIFVAGTASVAMLNTVNQQSLQIGDKYIIIMSGATDHTTLSGSGILWGSGSTGPTYGPNGEHAYVRYDSVTDKLEIFPGLETSVITASSISASNYVGVSIPINSGAAGRVAYYPSPGGTTIDDSGIYWDNATSRVGIGTTTPERTLDINGAQIIRGLRLYHSASSENYEVQFGPGAGVGDNDQNYGIFVPTGSSTGRRLALTVGGNGIFVSGTSAGSNLGVNTNTPDQKLVVSGTSILKFHVNALGDISSNTSIRPHFSGANSDFSIYEGNVGSGILRFRVSSSGDTNLAPSGGKVGIGIPTPAYKLEVNGTISGSAVYGLSGASAQFPNFTNDVRAQFTAGTNITINNGQISASGGAGSGTVNTGSAGYIAYYPSLGTTVDDTSQIYTDGTNVGVGTTTLGAKLDVGGTVKLSRNDVSAEGGEIQFARASDNVTKWIIDTRGTGDLSDLRIFDNSSSMAIYVQSQTRNVGIGGTTSPSSKLYVDGTITIGTNNQVYQAGVLGYNDTNWGFLYRPPRTGSLGAHNFEAADGTDLLIIQNGGNVGIGTTNPSSYKLQVNGTISGSSVYGLSGASAQFPNFSSDVRKQISSTGTGGSYDSSTGVITFAAAATTVNDIYGTTNQIYLDDGVNPASTGPLNLKDTNIFLSLPQSIATTDIVTFNRVLLTDASPLDNSNAISAKNAPKAWAKIRLASTPSYIDRYNFTTSIAWTIVGQKLAVTCSLPSSVLLSGSINSHINYSTLITAPNLMAFPTITNVQADTAKPTTATTFIINFTDYNQNLKTMTSSPYIDSVPQLNINLFGLIP